MEREPAEGAVLNPEPLRIAYIMLSAGWGGMERSLVDLAGEVQARGHRTLMVVRHAFPRPDALEAVPGMEVIRIPARGNWDYPSLIPLIRAVRRFGAQVIHGSGARAAWMAGWAGRALGIPVVVKLPNYMRRKYTRNVGHFITTTRDQADFVARWGVSGDRVRVIPNFSRLAPAPSVRVFRQEPPTFVSMGRFVPKKGFDLLLRAFRETLDRGIAARLLLAGSGPEEASLRELAGALGLGERVEFVGWVDDVPAFLDRGDVFVLPSRQEPFGIVLPEAMSRGMGIVSTLAEGPREILDERTAWLAEVDSARSLAEALARSVSDRDGTRARAEAALNRYREDFHVDRVVPRVLAYYRDILGAQAPPALRTRY